ncbi:MAG: hypothetical protein E7Z88_05955 [Cyanobacteria bacterium SIG27]|nr:hypothetical protein [Cyanobacteria bacterium SIG27]
MTIIRPTNAQDIAIKAQLQEAANKAKLTLSETLALNMKYGTNLEYVPQSDVVEITSYFGKRIKNTDTLTPFEEACCDLVETFNKAVIHHIRRKDSITSSLEGNVKSALKKLKSVL